MAEKIPNFHEVSKTRSQKRKAVGELEKTPRLAKVLGGQMEAELKELNAEAKKFRWADFGGLSGARKALLEQKKEADDRAWIDGENIGNQIGPVFGEVREAEEGLKEMADFELRRRRESHSDPYARKAHESILESVQKEKESLLEKMETLRQDHPLETRAFDLARWARGLHEAGHIASTPSVEEYVAQIGERMITGKPMFLHGPTGTGKTSLARLASARFTGQEAEMVYCNPQTRESNVFSKTAIGSGGTTYIELMPLLRAAKEGRAVIFDEFTALPKEMMVMLKGVMNKKVGDTITVPGNGSTAVKAGFQIIFTANLKSEKNQERQDIPPEMANEFDQNNLEVKYTPKEEAFDIMLARLLNPDGSLDLSLHDLNVTLPKLCEALSEIQAAYAGKIDKQMAKETGVEGLGGAKKLPGLQKLVLNQRTIEAILESWRLSQDRQEKQSFTEFLDRRLQMSLTFKEYPEGDRALAAKILALKGFLTTLSPKDLDLPQDVFSFGEAKKTRGEEALAQTIEASGKIRHLSIKEVSALDPFNVRARQMAEVADDFLEDDPRKKDVAEIRALRKKMATLGVRFEDVEAPDLEKINEAIAPFLKDWLGSKAQITPSLQNPKNQDWPTKETDIDQSKFGEYALNPETQALDFETAKVFVPDLSAFNGKKLSEVAQHLIQTYGDKYHIPGIEYLKWLRENPDKNPNSAVDLKDGKYNFLFGSLLRDSDGHWSVPRAYWSGSAWTRSGFWLGNQWDDNFRVVLLEKN